MTSGGAAEHANPADARQAERSAAYYERLGFSFGEPWGGFYAIGCLDGLELPLKEAPKNPAERHRRENEHLDASAGVEGIEEVPAPICVRTRMLF